MPKRVVVQPGLCIEVGHIDDDLALGSELADGFFGGDDAEGFALVAGEFIRCGVALAVQKLLIRQYIFSLVKAVLNACQRH